MNAKNVSINKLDGLISFYEMHMPSAGQRIEVDVTPMELAKMLGRRRVKSADVPTEYEYRGRIIFTLKRDAVRKRKKPQEPGTPVTNQSDIWPQ